MPIDPSMYDKLRRLNEIVIKRKTRPETVELMIPSTTTVVSAPPAVDMGEAQTTMAGIVDLLRKCIAERIKVRIIYGPYLTKYSKARRNQVEKTVVRDVEPYEVKPQASGALCLWAYSPEVGTNEKGPGIRSYRLDKISQAQATGVRFIPNPAWLPQT